MSGVELGPLEIFVSCDSRYCGAQALIFQGDPATNPVEKLHELQGKAKLPPGWTWRGEKTFCPKHA